MLNISGWFGCQLKQVLANDTVEGSLKTILKILIVTCPSKIVLL